MDVLIKVLTAAFLVASLFALSCTTGQRVHKFILRFEKAEIWVKAFYRKFLSLREELTSVAEQVERNSDAIVKLQNELHKLQNQVRELSSQKNSEEQGGVQ